MNSLKNIIAIVGVFISTIAFTQDKLWITIDNQNDVPTLTKNNNQLTIGNETLQGLINEFGIVNFQLALPSSRKEHLKKVYEITIEGDVQGLYKVLSEEGVEWTKPEFAPEYELLHTPNDYNIEFGEDYALDMIRAEGAWEYSTGDTNVVIGISDGNYFLNHEELVGEYTYVAPNITSPYYEHGTAVAALAAGNTNNGVGKSSIGYDCKLSLVGMNYNQVLDLSYMGVRVINLSWSSGCWFNQYTQDVINECYDNGTIIVAAAGNGSTCGGASNLVYPAAHDHVIAVSSVGRYDNHEDVIGDSTTCHQHNSEVDIVAPGYNVPLTAGLGWYLGAWGSSFAAPQVSGTIGLMLSIKPCLTYEAVLEILQLSSINIDAQNPNYVGQLGFGRLDAANALKITSEYQGDNDCDGVQINDDEENTTVYSDYGSVDFNSQYASIEDLSINNINIYPNPSNGIFNIELNSKNIISGVIIDQTGKQIYNITNDLNKFKINLSTFNPGIYFMRLLDINNNYIVKKLVLK